MPCTACGQKGHNRVTCPLLGGLTSRGVTKKPWRGVPWGLLAHEPPTLFGTVVPTQEASRLTSPATPSDTTAVPNMTASPPVFDDVRVTCPCGATHLQNRWKDHIGTQRHCAWVQQTAQLAWQQQAWQQQVALQHQQAMQLQHMWQQQQQQQQPQATPQPQAIPPQAQPAIVLQSQPQHGSSLVQQYGSMLGHSLNG